ncbi:MAG: GNAT family N-acetyltransferase [Moraxellaceae bacterium]|nr:GNAT family N-acetyltransferase [Pseudobdellovibrionaceae bacterium]
MSPLPILQTDRLILRPLKIEDAQSIFEYAKNPQVSKYTLWEVHQTVADSLDDIQNYSFHYYARGEPEALGRDCRLFLGFKIQQVHGISLCISRRSMGQWHCSRGQSGIDEFLF